MSAPEAEASARAAAGAAGPTPEQPGTGGPGGPDDARPDGTGTGTGDGDGEPEERDQPQNAWSARRDLVDHSPRTMNVGARTRFSGGLLGGDQHGGISGGNFSGDVFLGSKTEVYQFAFPGFATSASVSGEVPRTTLEHLATHFVADEEVMSRLLDRLRRERVLVLSGGRFTGRRTAALMLLHRLGASPVRTLDRDTGPSALAEQFPADNPSGDTGDASGSGHASGSGSSGSSGDAGSPAGPAGNATRGYVLCDLTPRRDNPLREHHVLATRDRLTAQNSYLVITVGPTAVLEDIPVAEWQPPAPTDVLTARLRTGTDAETAAKLLDLPTVTDFLDRGPQLREIDRFTRLLSRYAAGEVAEDAVARFSLGSLENQVQEWFEEDETSIHLRDKAFLVALAAFDGGPYALTAELSDLLYRFLQETENPARVPEVPVFGTHLGKRLQLARARPYLEDEHTEWGPVTQHKAAFRDDRAPFVLLREVWTGHPSARPALISWLRRLADDGRPLVRTRAASTVAVLARADLPSAMALVIEPWATSKPFRQRLVAVNALTLAHLIDTPNVPRILDAWCEGDDPRRRWVAVRAYGLIGPERPVQALAALRGAVRRLYADDPDDLDGEMARELAETVGLLLISPASEQVLTELRAHIEDDRAVRDLTLGGFVGACRRTEDDERYGTPMVLGWYARSATERKDTAHGIRALWRASLTDPRTTRHALDVLREWVLIADRSTTTEWALASLLPTLVTTHDDHQRLSHLLRTMPGEDGAPPPPVAARLLTTLPPR
ncbi:hypothetical protein ACFS5L_42345 [Streptomyces phyllanthi]|uniref:HEAT repeat domain-containing protein n=1 Tax=Streptomyces phyllanthi TaxID=1803180 RepID=A0A5N8WGB3_9ACTN|nr:hypothetical protein [Streptomyces phyllanthi]MPY46510.1 hypothetical protein [Streptomyces phyllanthi]